MRTKKKKILRWSEVEEVVCRKFMNVDVGVDIYTKYKKCKSFNLITEQQVESFFKQVEKIKSQQDLQFDIVRDLEAAFRKSDYLNQWVQNNIQN